MAACSSYILGIVDKAEGVFLWVYQVVRSSLEGLRNEDGIKDLRRRLDLMPADFEKYFTNIFSTLEPFYLEQAMQLFEIALSAEGTRSLMEYSNVFEDDLVAHALKLEITVMSGSEIARRNEMATRRLNNRCKGLLEVFEIPGESSKDPLLN